MKTNLPRPTNLKSFSRYLRIAAAVILVVLPPLLLLLPSSLISSRRRRPGELAVATIGVAHGELAIRDRHNWGHSLLLCSCRQRFRIIAPRRRFDCQFGLEK